MPHVAIVGAGMAGAACAQGLMQAGCAVTVFEKSRGAGGRMATRRATFTDAHGTEQSARFDHGVPSFKAEHPEFLEAVTRAVAGGLVAPWSAEGTWVGCPEQPAWAKHLLSGATLKALHTVSALHHSKGQWFLECTESLSQGLGPFDAVVLAIPAPQAAALLAPLHSAWAGQARAVVQMPTWTLMAARSVSPSSKEAVLIRPAAGPLDLIIRNDGKPGRSAAASGDSPAQEHWVAHATVEWTLSHLEDAAERVAGELKSALEEAVGGPWSHTVVHRWRYALVGASQAGTTRAEDWASRPFLWDAARGLGVAGDAFAGPRHRETGVQRAWLSGSGLAAQVAAFLSARA